ncbi:TraB subfamily protein [Acanthamoeba castellanii str. Neff]|uniref:TraB subfamily protein n=1 Tax=Acanthamoeba castellanii (strain ATCC 30010 / Neff) TaxID=1257118 RepID=L8GFI4_ACACF|nr:TraB subfamily protein [Acanthamoeba castellanii str. Neff]ELR11589.1 TraB subfamily protein [Acanthamoeba castellanii str. Neff]
MHGQMQRWLATSAGSGGAPVYGHVTEGAEGDTVLYMRDTGSGREYWLIGTAHISKRSADQVELCEGRARRMQEEDGQDPFKQLSAQVSRIFAGPFAGFGAPFLEASLRSFYNVFKLLGFVPGLEFKVAMNEAKKLKIPVVYGDQESSKTFQRLSSVFSLDRLMRINSDAAHNQQMQSLFQQIQANSIEEMVEKLKNRKLVRRFVQVMKQAYPEVVNVMLTERDVVMAANLRRCPGKVVVGVVGLAHLDGIEKHFKPIMALPQL